MNLQDTNPSEGDASSRRQHQRIRKYHLAKASFGFSNICSVLGSNTEAQTAEQDSVDCMIVNTSLWGCCIHLMASEGVTVPVNEFVAVRENYSNLREKEEIPWSMGQIRWVRYTKESVLVGIRLIPPMTQLVEFCAQPNADAPGTWVRGLQIPRLLPTQMEHQLVTEDASLSVGDKICARTGRQSEVLLLTDMKVIADKYCAYSYSKNANMSSRELLIEPEMEKN